MQHVCAKFLPCLSTKYHEENRGESSKELLVNVNDDKVVLKNIRTEDEAWAIILKTRCNCCSEWRGTSLTVGTITSTKQAHPTVPSHPTSNYIHFMILHPRWQHIQHTFTSNAPLHPSCHYIHRATASIPKSKDPTSNHIHRTCRKLTPSPVLLLAPLVIRLTA